MLIKNVFILAAGLGTRMGKIGNDLPKPLWPVGNKTLLEWQIQFARDLGAENIFINLFHRADFIQKYLGSPPNVNFLVEEEILGTGGAIHNLIKVFSNVSELLILNSDQFYFFDQLYFKKALDSLKIGPAGLFSLEVQQEQGYNRILEKENLLVGIEKNQDLQSYLTYSGMGLIDCSQLSNNSGFSSFFDTVANYKKQKVTIIQPKNSDYFDFGTKERYCFQVKNIWDHLNKKNKSSLLNFFLKSESENFRACFQNEKMTHEKLKFQIDFKKNLLHFETKQDSLQ